jgi:prophage regulatory protein
MKVDVFSNTQINNVQLLTVKEVAGLLGIHERTVWKMASASEIPKPIKIGSKSVRWRLNDLRNFIQKAGV